MALIVMSAGSLAARADPPTLPNVIPQAPYDVHIGAADAPEDQPPPDYPWAIRFSTKIINKGLYPLDLLASPDNPANVFGDQTAVANQCTVFVARACLERQAVGTFGWNTYHQHFHIDAFAQYELRRMIDPRTPDWTDAGLVAGGKKITFCMEDTDFDDSWQATSASTPTYRDCDGVVQGISAGFYDEYPYGLDGQQLSLKGLGDGLYAIVINLNPDGAFFEMTRADDTAWTAVRLTDGGNTLTVLGTSGH